MKFVRKFVCETHEKSDNCKELAYIGKLLTGVSDDPFPHYRNKRDVKYSMRGCEINFKREKMNV